MSTRDKGEDVFFSHLSTLTLLNAEGGTDEIWEAWLAPNGDAVSLFY